MKGAKLKLRHNDNNYGDRNNNAGNILYSLESINLFVQKTCE